MYENRLAAGLHPDALESLLSAPPDTLAATHTRDISGRFEEGDDREGRTGNRQKGEKGEIIPTTNSWIHQ